MPLNPSTIASGLEKMAPTSSEPDVINQIADIWRTYFGAASVAGVPAAPGSFDLGITAMKGAMVGITALDAAALAIQNGVTAFWTAIMPAVTTIWVLAPGAVVVPPLVPPLLLPSLAADLTTVFLANTAASASLHDSATAIAAVMHKDGGFGATISTQTPPVTGPVVPLIPIV